jgi:transcription elongation factor Elf1
MLYIDAKYANILGSRLRNFKQKQDYVWNYSCPVCGDSSKNKTKARGYIYRAKSDLFVKCHKCGYGTNIGNLIKYVDPSLYDEYVMERYKAGATKHNSHKDLPESLTNPTPKKVELLEDDILAPLTRIDKLAITHPAVKYVIDRKIPRDRWEYLYFAPKFKAFTNSVTAKFQEPIVDEHPRMIIPYFTPAGKCFAFQARAYGNEEPKYYTIKVDETEEKIYGLDRVDYSKRIYIVEGPIDSMFLPNALAVSGSSFDTPTVRKLLTNATIVMDNEPRHKDIIRQLAKYIDLGYSVVMYPDSVKEKDINDMVKAGRSQSEILDLINTNTFSGIEAKLKFSEWKKYES